MKRSLVIYFEIIFFLLLLNLPVFPALSTIYINDSPIATEDTRSDDWIIDFQKNGFNNPQWYYKNLTAEDRLHIRQALDWSVDRNGIINNIENGYAEPILSSISPSSEYYLNNGTISRQVDLNKAKGLLAQVFGYSYSTTDNLQTPYNESQPYFSLTQLVPSSDPDRLQWAYEISQNLKLIGIEVITVERILDGIYSTIMDGKVVVNGTDYQHGGYDIAYIGWGDVGYMFNSPGMNFFDSFVPPVYDLFSNSEYNQMLNNIHYEQDPYLRNQSILNYQQWLYDQAPFSVLFRNKIVNIQNKDLIGIDKNVRSNYENWTYGGKQNVTIVYNFPIQLAYLNPVFNNLNANYPDYRMVSSAMFRGLFYSTSDVNSNGFDETNTYPYFADWYNKSADGKTWFVNLKQGLKWHDGVELNASDVKFTFDSLAFTNLSSGTTDFQYQDIDLYHTWLLGDLNITLLNSTLIKFSLEKPYSFFKEDYLTIPLIPEHILRDFSIDHWDITDFNLGKNGSTIGNGPYILVNNSVNSTILTLQKWNDWDSTYNSLIMKNAMNEEISNINAPTLDYINFLFDTNQEDVINGVKNGSIDITLQYRYPYDFISVFDQLTNPIKPVVETGFRIQFIHYNLKSPIWGMIPKEPCTIYSDVSCELMVSSNVSTSNSIDSTDTGTISPGFTFYSIMLLVTALIPIIYRKNKNH